jgi:hypothetical protein
MAFQTGSQIRPELARADVSGFATGGALIGAGIKNAVTGYVKKKKETKQLNAGIDSLWNSSQGDSRTAKMIQRFLGPEFGEASEADQKGAIKSYIKSRGGPKEAMQFLDKVNIAVVSAEIKAEADEAKRQRTLGGTTALNKTQSAIKNAGFIITANGLEQASKFNDKTGFFGGFNPVSDEDARNNPRLKAIHDSNPIIFNQLYPNLFPVNEPAAAPAAVGLNGGTDQDQEALDYILANPNDPRSEKLLKSLTDRNLYN